MGTWKTLIDVFSMLACARGKDPIVRFTCYITLHFFQALQIPDQDTPISACYQMRCDSDSLLLYLSDSTLFHYKL